MLSNRFIFNLRWHKLLFSIKGNSVTMIVDCNEQETQELNRNTPISESGFVMIGQQLDETFYVVILHLPETSVITSVDAFVFRKHLTSTLLLLLFVAFTLSINNCRRKQNILTM
jgi:hypothetical protein